MLGILKLPWNWFGASTPVTPPPTPTPQDPIVSPLFRANFTLVPGVAQVDRVGFTTAVNGSIVDNLGVVNAGYVTPVTLVVRRGAARMLGSLIATPVAGNFTFSVGSVAVELNEGISTNTIQLGIKDFEGASAPIIVSVPAPTATTLIEEQRVPSGSARATVQLVAPIAGGNIQFQGTIDGINWFLVDLLPFVGSTAANTFTAGFAGYANVSGLEKVRLVKSVVGVTFDKATLTVEETD